MPLASIAGSLAGGAISGIGSLVTGNTQAKAAQQAAALAAQNQQKSTQAQQTATSQNQANQNPYLQTGTAAQEQLAQGTQAGGNLIAGYGSTFQAPTGVTEQNDPGYQFRLQQGMNALQNSAAASGGLLTGGTAKAISDYAQGSASNEYGNVYNRALTTFNSGLNQFQQQQQNAYNRLSGVASTGQQAANELGQQGQAGAQNFATINSNATGQINQPNQFGAAATANGQAGIFANAANQAPGLITGVNSFINNQNNASTSGYVNDPNAQMNNAINAYGGG
jgi:hypothetical protein